jgi:hypothetical protein
MEKSRKMRKATKIYSILFLTIFLATDLFAINNKLALELSRAKKLDVVMDRINNIYEFVNLYILETSDTDINRASLQTQYSNNLVFTSFRKNTNISVALEDDTTVVFSDVVPDNLSKIIKQVYQNHTGLNENAVIESDYTIRILLKPATIQFLKKVSLLSQLSPQPLISSAEPTCSIASNNGTLWYQPDLNGDFYISQCIGVTSSWVLKSNKLNIGIYEKSINSLPTAVPVGTKAYVEHNATAQTAYEYIFDGANWQRLIQD